MADDLFFIPIIARALEEPRPKAAMLEAFEQIRAMGREPRYKRGYQQFAAFLDSAINGRWEEAPEEAGSLILEQYDRPGSVGVIVERDEEVVTTCAFERGAGIQTVENVQPGEYRLKLDTGRLLWAGELAAEDLIWSKAHPHKDLPAAADSGEASFPPTRELELLETTVLVRVRAGVESGRLEIELKDSGGAA